MYRLKATDRCIIKVCTFLVLLLVLTAISSVFLTVLADEDHDETETDEINLDFSCGDDCIAIAPSELIYMIGGYECSAAERDYIDGIEEYILKYTPMSDNRWIVLGGNADIISVKAYAVMYTGNNGETVVWTPEKVTFGETEITMSEGDGEWFALLEEAPVQDTYTFSVTYNALFELSADTLYEIFNRAYNDANEYTAGGDFDEETAGFLSLLAEEIAQGNLNERPLSDESVLFERTCVLDAEIAADELGGYPVLIFRDYDGGMLFSTRVTDGGLCEEDIPVPNLPDDGNSVMYIFNGWTDSDGNPFSFDSISADAVLYPDVREKTVTYSVTFVTASGSVTGVYRYGDMPIFTGKTEKQSDAAAFYSFAGWDRPVVPVTQDAIYTAVYTSDVRYYTVRWNIGGKIYAESFPYGEIPECPVDASAIEIAPTDTEYFVFAGWDREIRSVTGDATYNAVYDNHNILSAQTEEGITGLAVSISGGTLRASVPENTVNLDLTYACGMDNVKSILLSSASGYTVRLDEKYISSLNLSSGVVISVSHDPYTGSAEPAFAAEIDIRTYDGAYVSADGIELSAALPAVRLRLLCLDGDQWRAVNTAVTDGTDIVFRCEDGIAAFAAIREYVISVSGCTGCEISVTGAAAEGENIQVSVFPVPGYTDCGCTIEILDTDGNQVPADGSCFVMPASDVQISCICIPETYTVSFYSDGKLFFEGKVQYGEKVILPESEPVRKSGDGRAYRFEGWTPEIPDCVSGNLSFNALFTEIADASENENRFPLWIAVLAAMLIAAAAAVTVKFIPGRKK